MTIQWAGIAAHLGFLTLLVSHFQLDIWGVGFAGGLTNSLVFFALVIYTNFTVKGEGQEYNSFSKQSLLNYLKLGLPCTAMTMVEWCAYSLMTFQSGMIGVNE